MKKSGAREHLKLKLDLHVHTNRSQDAFTKPDELAPNTRRAGLDGLAITDHNILASNTMDGLMTVPGIEISSREGHIIGLGISAPVPRGIPADQTIQRIKQLGGVSIIAHPYDLFRSAIDPETLTVIPDAIETINSASFLHSVTWKRAREFAERNNLPQTAGSDSHIPETIGRAFTTIDCNDGTVSSILDAIREGSITPTGRPYRVGDRVHKLLRRR